VRFPFGRGARRREIDGLRQRVAELQDEITKLEESLAAEAPDVETTDAYRSVQVLRESMRREELTALQTELQGLEARLDTLTADRRPPAPVAAPQPAEIAPEAEALPEGTGESTADVAEETASVATPPPAAISDRGLPSERAIIEPALPPRAAAPAESEAPPEVAAGAGSSSEEPSEELAPTADVAEAEAAAAVGPDEATAAVPEPAAIGEAEALDAVPEAEATVPAGADEEPVEEELAPAALSTAPEPSAPLPAVDLSAEPATATVEEREAAVPAEAPADRRSSRWVLLLVAIAVIVVAAVAALESGLFSPGLGIMPGVAPTPLPTARPPTIALPTAIPTLAPTATPPTAVPLAGSSDDATVRDSPRPAEGISARIPFGEREVGARLARQRFAVAVPGLAGPEEQA
jgi:hypothetical protein